VTGIAPGRIVVAGDLGGNARWIVHVIREAASLLRGEPRKVILQLGDFQVRLTPGNPLLARIERELDASGAEFWVVEGNHEDHPGLARLRKGKPPYHMSSHMVWLPRGYRWAWHGRTWLACGGAVSLDRVARTEGSDWWPEEEITGEEETAVIAAGHADVLASHDCPGKVVHTFPHRPAWWDQRDINRSDAHRERLQRIVDGVQPSHIMHGHLHKGYSRICDFGYGPVQVTGLDADGSDLNFAVLNVRDMTWEVP
jgi:Icc-related predicted phosphoesterase